MNYHVERLFIVFNQGFAFTHNQNDYSVDNRTPIITAMSIGCDAANTASAIVKIPKSKRLKE